MESEMADTTEVTETVEVAVLPEGSPEATTERRPKPGELVAFGENVNGNPAARWFACNNVTFKRPSGDTGTLDWVVVTPEALAEAGGDPLKVKFVGSVVVQDPPANRVVELPDPPVPPTSELKN